MLKPDKVPSWRRGGVPLLHNKLLAIDSYWEKENQVLDGMKLGLTTTPGQIPYPRVQHNKSDYLKREKDMKFAG